MHRSVCSIYHIYGTELGCIYVTETFIVTTYSPVFDGDHHIPVLEYNLNVARRYLLRYRIYLGEVQVAVICAHNVNVFVIHIVAKFHFYNARVRLNNSRHHFSFFIKNVDYNNKPCRSVD